MQLPEQLLTSLEGIEGFDKQAFEEVHAIPKEITSIRINPLKWLVNRESAFHDLPFTIQDAIPWTQYGYYLSKRPSFTFDPIFHAGCYYVQEASSMFLEQALKQSIDLTKSIKVLDLCAAPGGKSTHIQSLISKGSLLVSNDVIKSRANILKDNVIKWGGNNVVVTNNDPKDFAKLKGYFDVIVVDAPCSGSGLFRRDEEAIGEWSPSNVDLCSQRQQRILADVWPALKNNGVLVYSTCSYSKEEDEEILDWLEKQFAVRNLRLTVDGKRGVTEVRSNSGSYGYRFWPHKLRGEGFFISCFYKTENEDYSDFKIKTKLEKVTAKEMQSLQSFVEEPAHSFFKNNNLVYAMPEGLKDDINLLLGMLRVQYSGVLAGELFGEKFVPAHSLSMSGLVNNTVPAIELTLGDAIKYLQRKDLTINDRQQGWHLVKFQGYNLGWVKILSNRVNNYYPKELRILKDN
ncbi:MAG: hypothetical protein QM764_01020 [Chitinophagaceae bacterium]